jgi:transposase
MATVVLKTSLGRKKIIPLVMALGNMLINKTGLVELINKRVEWDPSQWRISPGNLIKALVLSTFTDIRIPLTRLSDRLAGLDLGYLLGYEAETSGVNSFNVGRALQRLGESDYCDQIYETLALTIVKDNNIPLGNMHADTTTISFYGEYDFDKIDLTEEEKEMLLHIEKGYNKDGRPECKQVVVGQIVSGTGIPVVSRVMDGTTSDAAWNAEAISYMKKVQNEGFAAGVFVADCKLVNSILMEKMSECESMLKFVSRCPASFEGKLESRMIEKAYDEGCWEDYGKLAPGEKASSYRGVSFTEAVCGHNMRLLVIESSSLVVKAQMSIEKEKVKLEPMVKALKKKTFACKADAEAEADALARSKHAKLFIITPQIERNVKEVWQRGRRKATTTPKIVETFRVADVEISNDEEICKLFMQNESCFVLISSVLDGMDNRELLATYKGQQVVENSFRQLKHPQLASVMYLKSPQRLKALSMVLSFSLLIRAVIQHRMREGLSKFREENPGAKLKVGWNGRELANPTYMLLYEHSFDCYFEREERGKYSFEWPYVESEERVGALLSLMGLDVLDLIE